MQVVVNDSLPRSRHIPALFQAVTAKLTPLLRYGFSQLALYEPATGQLETRACYFPNGKGLMYEGLRFPIANTPAGRVFTTGRPMRIGMAEALPRSDLIKRLLAEGVRSGCCVPLRSGETIVGTLSIGSSQKHAFTVETEQFLTALGNDLGPLVERTAAEPNEPMFTPWAAHLPFSPETNHLLTITLIERVRAGDVSLFHELIRPYKKAIYSIAFSMLRDHADAEEVAQETALKALTHLHQLLAPDKFRQWLLQIALNEARLVRRRNKGHVHEPLDSLDGRLAISTQRRTDPVELQEFEYKLKHALRLLPRSYRQVFILRDIEDCTVPEAAAILGISIANVKTRLHRARKALRNTLLAEFIRAA